MFNWNHYHLFKCACKNHTKYKTYTLPTRIVARLVISYSKYNSPQCCLDVPKNVSRFLRVFSVIIEIINYAFKFGKCASSAHIFFLISGPPSIFSPRCARWVASLEKRPKLRHCLIFGFISTFLFKVFYIKCRNNKSVINNIGQ